MAYSMLECPKLQNARSLKFYPEEYDHHLSLRHKNLPPDYELKEDTSYTEEESENYTIPLKNSKHKKCPIYVHHFDTTRHNEGDFIKNPKKPKNKKKNVIRKLEETYWANWKPDKNSPKNTVPYIKSSKSPEIQIIKSAPAKKKKYKIYPPAEESPPKSKPKHKTEGRGSITTKKIYSKSQEIQTEEIKEIDSKDTRTAVEVIKEEEIIEEKLPEEPPKNEPPPKSEPAGEEEIIEEKSEEVLDNKFLKHTDSFIINSKKQREEKDDFDQPKCIRLYKKPTKMTSKNIIRGGSYPLKSCLKNESGVTRGNSRLGRPGSPVITSSNFSSKSKNNKTRHQPKF